MPIDPINLRTDQIKTNFYQSIISVDETATEIYKSYERSALFKLAENWLEMQKGKIKTRLERLLKENHREKFKKEASEIFTEFGIIVQALEKDLGNIW